jgi:ribosome maturation factor RimP
MAVVTNETLGKVRSFVESSFDGRYEVYDLHFKSLNKRWVLQIFLDREEGISIQDCETVSRAVSRFLDEADLIHCRFTLEVSSPGVERKLKRPVDFQRHVGKLVRWVLKPEGEKAKEVFQARLQEYSPEKILVLQAKGLREFALSQVEEAQTVFEFPKKARD